jgi:hypothetical protein
MLQRTEIAMLGLRLNPPRPFWFQDLMYFVVDEGRLLPTRCRELVERVGGLAETVWQTHIEPRFANSLATLREKIGLGIEAAVAPQIKPRHVEAELLDEPLTWSLATEPLVTVTTGAEAAIALHKAAGEQLDALTYALDRLRDELRPLMSYEQIEHGPIQLRPTPAELENSIEQLLELSRRNATTRPKGRMATAA